MNKILVVKCPQCNTEFQYYTSESRPFCSERCKMIDLGHWFEESYRVPDKNANIPEENLNSEQGEELYEEDDQENY